MAQSASQEIDAIVNASGDWRGETLSHLRGVVLRAGPAVIEEVKWKKPSPTPTGCHPLTNSGNCYEPGEYCRDADHGASGVAGDGEAITCQDNNGWRWEPS